MFGISPFGNVITALGEAVVLSVTPPAGPKVGSTDVIIRGLNFQTGSTVKFGTTTQSGASFVDATTYTLTTQAGDSNYVDDVSVVPSVGATGLLSAGYDRLSSVPSTLDPATKALTGFWASSYTGTPAVGSASAGSSATNNMDTGASGQTPPTTGATLNGYVAQRYNSSGFVTNASSTTLLGTTSWSWQCMLNVASLDDGHEFQGYADPPVWNDSIQTIGVTVSKTGIRAYQANSGGGYYYTPDVLIPAATWVLVQARWTGTLLQLRVNCGPWQSVSMPSIFAIGPNIWSGFSGYARLTGDKLFECFQDSSWTNAEADKIAAYTQSRFALTGLGFPTGTVLAIDPATLDESAYFIDYPGTSWTGTASAGVSGSTNLTAGSFVAPGTGTLNGHGTATLNGSTQAFQSSVATNVVLGTEPAVGWTMVYLVKFTTLSATGGIPYVDSDLFTDPQAVLGIGASSDSGIQCFQIDENDGYSNYVKTPDTFAMVPTSTWMVVNGRWDGNRKLDIRTLDGTVHEWSPILCRAPCYPTGAGQPYVGTNYAGAAFTTGEIAAIAWSKKVYSTDALNGVTAFLQNRYALTLGVVSSFTGTGNAAVSPLAAGGVGKLTFTGTGGGALSPLAVTGAAKETFTGSGGGAVSPLACTGSGALTFSGVCGGAVSPLAVTGAGKETFTGTCNAAQSSLATNFCTGTETFTGSGGGACSPLAVTGVSALTFSGSGGGAISPLVVTGVAALTFSGAVSAAASPLACSGSGKETFTGVCGGALSPLACSGVGTVGFTGSGGGALSPLAVTGAAKETFTGSGGGACSPLTAGAAGALTFSGSGGGAISPLAITGIGSNLAGVSGSGGAAISPLAGTGTGSETFSGTVGAAMSPLACSSAGILTFTGTVVSAVSSLGGTGLGFLTFTGAAGAALSPLDASGVAFIPLAITGTGSAALAPLGASGTGLQTFTGSGGAAVSPFDCSGSSSLVFMGTGTGAFSPQAGSGFAKLEFVGVGSATVSSLVVDISGHYSVGDVFGTGGAAFSHFKARGYQTLPVAGLTARTINGIIVNVSPAGTLTIVSSGSGLTAKTASGNLSSSAAGSEITPVVIEGNVNE